MNAIFREAVRAFVGILAVTFAAGPLNAEGTAGEVKTISGSVLASLDLDGDGVGDSWLAIESGGAEIRIDRGLEKVSAAGSDLASCGVDFVAEVEASNDDYRLVRWVLLGDSSETDLGDFSASGDLDEGDDTFKARGQITSTSPLTLFKLANGTPIAIGHSGTPPAGWDLLTENTCAILTLKDPPAGSTVYVVTHIEIVDCPQ